MDTRFALEPVWSWPVVVLVAVALPTLVMLTYPSRVRHLSAAMRRLLIGARLMAAVLLVFAMLRPEIQVTETDTKPGTLILLGDSSRSMTTKDGPSGMSRRETMVKMLTNKETREYFETLSELLDIQYYDFDNGLHAEENPSEDAEGKMTAIGTSLENVLRDVQGKQLVAVVLVTDGAQRALAPFKADPRSVARRYGELQIPLFPVAVGESNITDTAFDIAVEDLVVSPVVFVKNTIPVSAKIRLAGAAGRRVSVQLLVEDSEGNMRVPPATNHARPSIVIETKENVATIPVELSWSPQLPGEFRIGVQVKSIASEIKTTNNRRETLVTVQKGGISVAYFDTAREEQHFLPSVNEARQIQLDFHSIKSGAFAKMTRIDPSMFEPGRYDVYIIGDVPASSFSEAMLKDLGKRVEDDGAGLIMLGGFFSFGPGGYSKTPLDSILPVRMSDFELQDSAPGAKIDDTLHHLRDLKMLPTQAGERHFLMRLSGQKNRARWLSLPPILAANKLTRKNNSVDVLAQSEDGVPLMFAHEFGRSRVIALAPQTTWVWWKIANRVDDYQRFWRQVIMWLAHKELDTDKPIWVKVDPRNFSPDANVQIEFGANDDESKPLENVDYNVTITNPKGEEIKLSPRVSGADAFADFKQTAEPGIYRATVNATHEGQIIPGTATTRFLVDSRDIELDNPAADTALLKDIAKMTGGRMIPHEEFDDFLRGYIEDGIPNLTQKHTTRYPLWDNWPYLVLFVLLMSVEWFLRKKTGLV